MAGVYKEQIKNVLFRVMKFMANDKEVRAAVRICFKATDFYQDMLAKDFTQQEIDARLDEEVNTYSDTVKSLLNGYRNEVHSQIRDMGNLRRKAEKRIPTSEELLEIVVNRQIPLPPKPTDSEEDKWKREVFVWWVDKIMPKVCGNKRWSLGHKTTATISKQTLDPTSDVKACNPGDEAFAFVCFENAEKRWNFQVRLGPNLGAPLLICC